MIKKILLMLLLITLISFISAQGCCLNIEDGFCSLNSEQSSCESLGGRFFDSPSCAVEECDKGCCVLGTNSLFVTERTCQVTSKQYGFETNFQFTDEESCLDLGREQATGACVYEGEYENECVFTTQSECSGEFYQDTPCSAEELDTVCEKTEETICYKESVYYTDTCGNPDSIKEECDYGQESICRTKNNKEAFCENLNCDDSQNGEKWCTETDPNKVGSRYFSQYCLNGKVYTEPCADFRMESCSEGVCQIEPGLQCLGANQQGEEGDSESDFEIDTESCGEGCYIFGDDTDGLLEKPLSLCLPEIPVGIHFYQSKNTEEATASPANVGESATTSSGEEPYCSKGNYEAEIKFRRTSREDPIFQSSLSKIRVGDWRLFSDSGEGYGNAGLVSLDGGVWGYGDGRNIFCLRGNPLHKKDKGSWSIFDKDFWLTIIDVIQVAAVTYLAGPVVGVYWVKDIFQYDIDWLNLKLTMNYHHCGKLAREGGLELPVDGNLIGMLNTRCEAIGDCLGKKNWIDSDGVVVDHEIECEGEQEEMKCIIPLDSSSNGGKELTFKFSYKCKPFKAPPNAQDCSLCGEDGLPCSEYRCKALGQKCEYFEPTGIDNGYCAEGEDATPPSISHTMTPASPIPPYTSAEIILTTDELSTCKFNIGSGQGTYEEMDYSIGGNFALNHTLILNLPGQRQEEEVIQYDLITTDGIYDMYIRCEDALGNFNIAPYHFRFEVQQTPDIIPPIIVDFTPDSGSAIKYNTTSKKVELKLNEPSECRWSTKDELYEEMSNNFSCDMQESDRGLLDGYFCSGELSGITQKIGNSTTFYIRCKDQPWLEGQEDDLYFRNTNTKSKTYTLKPSIPLEILELTPTGEVLKAGDTSVEIVAKTAGGGYNGIAECKWRLFNNTGFVLMEETSSTRHSQITSQLEGNDYKLEVKCVDEAQNTIEQSSNFRLTIDDDSPRIVRAYEKAGALQIVTDEEAICKFTTDSKINCRFDFDNKSISVMDGVSKEHSTDWVSGVKYYVRCKDYRENLNSGCGIIVRTY